MADYSIMIKAMLNQDAMTQGTPFEQLQAAYLSIQLDQAQQEINHLRAEQQQAAIKIASLEEENARLKEQLKLAQNRCFGKKRDAGEKPIDAEGTNNATLTIASHTLKKKNKSCGRVIDLSTLPHHYFHHDLREDEKICLGCNKPFHFIGKETSEGQLEIL